MQESLSHPKIAMRFGAFLTTFGETEPQRLLRYAEPFRGQQQATSMQLQQVLAVTSRARELGRDGATLMALATELQRHSYLPGQRSLAQAADPAIQGLALSPDEASAVVGAAAYARTSTFSNEINTAYVQNLERPLQQQATDPEQACHAAATAITALLRPA